MQLRRLYFSFSRYGEFGVHMDYMVIIRIDKHQLLMYALLSLFPVKDSAPERVLLKFNLITYSSFLSSDHDNNPNFMYFTQKSWLLITKNTWILSAVLKYFLILSHIFSHVITFPITFYDSWPISLLAIFVVVFFS